MYYYIVRLSCYLVLWLWCNDQVIVVSAVPDDVPCAADQEGSWSIGVVSGPDPFHLQAPTRHSLHFPCLRNPVLTCAAVTDVNASFVADPFLYLPSLSDTDDNWYMFFEVKNVDRSLHRRHGQIAVAISQDKGQSWTYLQIVLKQAFHLSYPQVFKHEGSMYMIPEQWSSMTLYKAQSFPTKWTVEKVLHKNAYIDPSIVLFEGVWWMFALIEQRGHNFAHVLFADSPLGPWVDHPHNCNYLPGVGGDIQCIGKNVTIPHAYGPTRRFTGARSGGRAFVYQHKLYRVVQHTKKTYGDGLDLYEVTSLSKTEPLQQKIVPEFNVLYRTPNNVGLWNLARYHHLDLHQTKDADGAEMWVGAMDGDRYAVGDKRNDVLYHSMYHETKEEVKVFNEQCAHQVLTLPVHVPYPIQGNKGRGNQLPHSHLRHTGQHLKKSMTNNSIFSTEKASEDIVHDNRLCFLSGASSNHYHDLLAFIESVQYMYPCVPIYIYNLGLTDYEINFLKHLPFVALLSISMKRPFFEYGAKAVKPVFILDFLNMYQTYHHCHTVFYGDTSIRMVNPMDKRLFAEVRRSGIVTELPSTRNSQVAFTHPGMFPYFHYNRETEYYLLQNTSRDGLYQTQSGLMVIDGTNSRQLVKGLFTPWAVCAQDPDCLSPDGVKTGRDNGLSDNHRIVGRNVFRTHRDDQSAFSFLLDTVFGRSVNNSRQVYLNNYAVPKWRSTSNEALFKEMMTPLLRSYQCPRFVLLRHDISGQRHSLSDIDAATATAVVVTKANIVSTHGNPNSLLPKYAVIFMGCFLVYFVLASAEDGS